MTAPGNDLLAAATDMHACRTHLYARNYKDQRETMRFLVSRNDYRNTSIYILIGPTAK